MLSRVYTHQPPPPLLLVATFIHLLACKRAVAPEADDTRAFLHICCPRAVKPAVRQPSDRSTDTRKYHRKRGYDVLLSLPPLPSFLSGRSERTSSFLPGVSFSFKISLEFDVASKIPSRSFASIAYGFTWQR